MPGVGRHRATQPRGCGGAGTGHAGAERKVTGQAGLATLEPPLQTTGPGDPQPAKLPELGDNGKLTLCEPERGN